MSGLLRTEGGLAPTATPSVRAALQRLLATGDDPVALGLRLTLGLVMLPHGLQKTLGGFGGYGFEGTMGFFTGTMHIPWPFALAAILAESLGALALVLGLGGRAAALGIAVNMAVAALTSHLDNGFFMNWFGNQKGEGFEYHLLAIGIALAVVVRGSGRWSLDRWLARS
ncbi:DoxX family protein [Aggregicoccus sp. 17bor-14]|uniref:DoxX family protein n=1 Tax=Myxococcaceae TaxID=31 RepID=UPI00129D11F2|nr:MULTISPECIES: DoxX family protein [Myxococcaceae]MBF5045652.1 DoxX family protein [Simulacricoccus sp. 17bor-14]MRI91389.1 DoxX family protein [Aggregicoccus sp. 17bor-14]